MASWLYNIDVPLFYNKCNVLFFLHFMVWIEILNPMVRVTYFPPQSWSPGEKWPKGWPFASYIKYFTYISQYISQSKIHTGL